MRISETISESSLVYVRSERKLSYVNNMVLVCETFLSPLFVHAKLLSNQYLKANPNRF